MTKSSIATLLLFALAPLCANGQAIPAGTPPEKIIRLKLAEKRVLAAVQMRTNLALKARNS